MHQVDCTVIGAGVVGLAVARAMALAGHSTVIIERERQFGSITSSRNSEVIHAGIYYPSGSIKARSCVVGKAMLYRYCEDRHVAHRRCGKLIVATSEDQLARLHEIRERASQAGVNDLKLIGSDEVASLEPDVRCCAALHSPSTGIIDSHGYMLSLLGDATDADAQFACSTEVTHLRPTAGGVELSINGETEPELLSRFVVNAAGLESAAVARLIDGLEDRYVPATAMAKGNYFSLSARSPFARLIYPVPEPGGLGVHLTFDLAGQARFGPDVEWIDAIDYSVDPARCESFYAAIRRYWPGLPDDSLIPAYAGIRPKLVGADDFRISGEAEHGIPGLINLFGIESPGLTASLAIADLVAEAAAS